MKNISTYLLLSILFNVCSLDAQQHLLPWSQRIVQSVITRCPDTIQYVGSRRGIQWGYETGVVLQGVYQVYSATNEKKYLDYIQKQIDLFVQKDGSIKTYDFNSFNIDNIPTGRLLLALYKETGEKKYKIAADTLRRQLAVHPRTNEGGFWHKNIYPYQMWLDGLYMAEPFYAEYALAFHEAAAFDDIANQFIFIESHTYDPKTGLLYHAWDESRKQKWADSVTGCSPNFWGRAMGWYAWGLADALDYFPEDHPKRSNLVALLQKFASAIVKYREPKSGLWYQVVDQGAREGNYLESSASCMFVYTLAKGARLGYLDSSYRKIAEHSFKGILDSLVTVDTSGLVNIHNACSVAGLGGSNNRSGSFEYYISERKRTNDFKAVGPFILAALEIEQHSKNEKRER